MQVGEPALNLIGISRGHAFPRCRVDHGCSWLTLIEPVSGDPSRWRPADLLDTRIDQLDTVRESGDRQFGLCLRRGKPLGRRKDRQRRATQAEDSDEQEGQQTRPAMECTDHGPAPHMS